MGLSHLFKQCWSLYVQYNKRDLMFRYAEETGAMPPEGIHEEYSIEPKGGLDFINRQFSLQKAVARMQMFQGNPFVNLATGFPVQIKPSDDHKIHIQVLFQFNQAAQVRQQPVDQASMQVLMQHLQQHLAALEQVDPNTSRAIQKQLRDAAKQEMRAAEQIAPQGAQPAAPMPA
jgi:hypothetical protein